MSHERLPDVNVRLLYYRYMNKLEKEVNVKLGFGLLGAGFVAAALGLLVFVYSMTLPAQSSAYFTWAQPAYALGLLALPVVLLGIVVLLPPDDRRLFGVAAGGLLVCVAATVGFLVVYHQDWFGRGADHTLYVLLPYAAGVAALALGMAASLREHAPELIETVTRIHQPEPDVGGESDADGGSDSAADAAGADAADADAAAASDVADSVPDETAVVDQGSDVDETAVIDTGPDAGGPAGTGDGPVTLVLNGRRYSFGDGDTFGRREEPWLDDLIAAADGHEEIPYVSSEHLEFSVEDDGVYVTDTSRNGTSLNGRDISGETAKLSDGDTLILADRAKLGVEL